MRHSGLRVDALESRLRSSSDFHLMSNLFGLVNSKALKLKFGDATYEFASAEDFAFALAGRAGVPGTRVGALVEMTAESLRREAEAIRQVEQVFNDALDGSLRDVTRIGPFLKEIDLSLISHDHDWRAIIGAVNAIDEPLESYKKVALVKYVQYLAARRQAVTAIYSVKRGSRADTGADADGKLRETAIFDIAEVSNQDVDLFIRMPKGETVEIDLAMDGPVAVLLAKHRCRIESNGKVSFVDDSGRVTQLRRGKNIVGRDTSCDVQLNVAYREVSRKHLIVEVADPQIIRLTDISSHGTSLSPKLLENTSI